MPGLGRNWGYLEAVVWIEVEDSIPLYAYWVDWGNMRFWAFRFELVGRKIAREGVKKRGLCRRKNLGPSRD